MAKKSSSRRDFSIPGDELEQHRIQLEHNLQNTDLSLHLSSVQDDDAGDHESLEHPRHDSAPDHFHAFASFDQHSREDMDLDVSRIRAWSIHDDEGIAPYDVRTMSTAAHHASAVTITAGLARGVRREPSNSGVEYDPERPLQDIIAACHVGSDEDEAEKSHDISRPKLSETLQRVGFSPRRPRGGQSRGSQLATHGVPESPHRRDMTPRARKVTVSFDTTATPIRRYVSQPVVVQPHVNVQPPTPSTSGSRFTKMARGLARDVREAQEQLKADDVGFATTAYRPAIKDVPPDLNHPTRAAKRSNRSRLHLPDVTGLTNAVVSPTKVTLERYSVRGPGSKEVEARLVVSLNALHTRLNHLETENSIARRRIRELEYELEECKRDVVRERTRIIESQDMIDVSAARIGSSSRVKGKEKRNKEMDPQASKYFEVVQEKKALEALITTLRSHLTRVTSDLSSQQQLLEELRSLRESDTLALAEKAQEINQLRTEVERLAGEIEVLRGVVEEGLNERRQGRDANDRLAEPPAIDSRHAGSPEPSVRRFIDDEEVDRISEDLDERRSERASNSSAHSSYSAPLPVQETSGNESVSSVKSAAGTRSGRRAEEPNLNGGVEHNPPFPKISSERLERLFFSAPRHNAASCRMCKGHQHSHGHGHVARRYSHEAPNDRFEDKGEGYDEGVGPRPQPDRPREVDRDIGRTYTIEEILERMDRNGGTLRPGDVPPQTVLARVIGELEDEFAHFREAYSSLAEEYRSLDCATQVAKRHVVGDRLRDVIDVLECRGNQIASLYDLLIFKDKPCE